MPKAVVDEARCQPAQCPNGLCQAGKHCPVKAIFQEEPNAVPFLSGGMCNGCFKCQPYCPSHAILRQ